MSADSYRLIDFGGGRKLESLSGRLIDRPSPAAQDAKCRMPAIWQNAESKFDADTKSWLHHSVWPESLAVDCGGFVMPVRPTPFGHIGIFPEQSHNWQWLRDIDNSSPSAQAPTAQALNLFAYTGASTMALVSAGFAVAHVDAAKPNVQSARAAASVNGWSDATIRYLVDDAAKFAAKEVRRGRQYHTIVLDPPAYGHGPRGDRATKAWRLQRDLWPLLEDCLRLVTPSGFRILATGHSPDVSASDVVKFMSQTHLLPKSTRAALRIQSGRSQLSDEAGRFLDAGFYVRIAFQAP